MFEAEPTGREREAESGECFARGWREGVTGCPPLEWAAPDEVGTRKMLFPRKKGKLYANELGSDL